MVKVVQINDNQCDHTGCFGNFDVEDPICKKHCALRIRCAVESDMNSQLEMMEEMLYSEGIWERIQ